MTLTQSTAQQRYATLVPESISYRFHLILQSQAYSGVSQISFCLRSAPVQLTLDCKAKQITSLIINEQPVGKFVHEDGFLHLEAGLLREGANRVLVSYRSKYDNDGNGCVNFVDVDGKQYIYTQFEPYYANRVFALFDQPDLKARMELSIVAPKDWERVLSNEEPIFVGQFDTATYADKIGTENKEILGKFAQDASGTLRVFPPTKMLPTYLYCFVAGAYKRLQLKQTYKNIPMSLFCIESLYPYLEKMAPFIFEITIECMKFFEQFFGVPYPFSKYDQVFAHEYKMGAMENAGIVTFNDLYIWKQAVSVETMLDLANTISHELSHHWFGNLSTMKWWDDLWLNESFAEFISHFCLEKIKDNLKTIKYESSMAAFLARKASGYHEDQYSTTHPIAGKVENTMVALSIFDGITYCKGASTLKQLLLLMGEQNFSKGLCAFFTKYGFKNATLDDFINELQNYFQNQHLTLQQWRSLWLQTPSLNILEAKWNPQSQDQQSVLQIHQSYFTEQYKTIRPHQIKIALFKEDCTFDVVNKFIRQKVQTVHYNGKNNYKAVLLNYEDHTFAKVNLDTASLDFYSSGKLVTIPDILTRNLIWRNFYDMVKDGVISSLKYIDIFEQNIAKEKSDSIFERHFEYIHTAINTYTPIPYRQELNARIFYFILQLIQSTDASEDNRLVILRSQLCKYAFGPAAVRILLAWRLGHYTPLKAHEMTIVQKWEAVVKAFRLPDLTKEEKFKLLQDQIGLDSSDDAKLNEATCKALVSTEDQFQGLYASFKNPHNEQSIALKRSVMKGWNCAYHSARLTSFKARYFQDLVEAAKILQSQSSQLFFQELAPIDDDLEHTIEAYRGVVFPEDAKYDKIRLDVRKAIDDLLRRHKAYARFMKFQPL